jgi:hypothetical protein
MKVKKKTKVSSKKSASSLGFFREEAGGDINDLRNEIRSMFAIYDDRINRIEDKVSSLRLFADDTKRSISEQNKKFDEKLSHINNSLKENIDHDNKKTIKVIRTLYKQHGEDVLHIKKAIEESKEESMSRIKLLDCDLVILARDVSKTKENVDEL